MRISRTMALFVAAGCLGTFANPSEAQPSAPAASSEQDLAWVESRVQEWQPAPDERRIDEVGWAADIRDAERLARETKRPIFLFSHDGRIDIGRC